MDLGWPIYQTNQMTYAHDSRAGKFNCSKQVKDFFFFFNL